MFFIFGETNKYPMKKSLIIVAMCFLIITPALSQGRILRKVANSVSDEILGSSNNTSKPQPEPACACSQPELIFDLGSKKLVYSEIGIDETGDGSLLIKDRMSQKYYIFKEGVTSGPFSETDPTVTVYLNTTESEEGTNPLLSKYNEYISKSGDKFLIKFNGKSYGPFARVSHFVVTKSKDKFAATVVENEVVTEDQGEKMEQAMKNAKSDQERMDLAMKFSQQMQQKMMAGGGPQSTTPKVISNIEGVTYNPMTAGPFSGDMKYDDILVAKYDMITDLKGNNIIALKPEYATSQHIYVNSSNTKYGVYDYGTVKFSDGTSMSDLFSMRLLKSDGKVFLAYLYYSPGKNALMQCKLPF